MNKNQLAETEFIGTTGEQIDTLNDRSDRLTHGGTGLWTDI